ncbi:hypothetical protein KJ632_02040, partial [Patescibacteria group bacterium]|nr:hypothetical protein [Patescibacteria group bacterium]
KKKKNVKGWLMLVSSAGLFVYYLVGLIPYVGWALSIVLFFVGLGGLALLKVDSIKVLKEKKMF